MVSLTNKLPVWSSVAISAVIFSAFHLLNPSQGVMPVVNLIIYGIFAALLFLRTDSIWMIAAQHSLWNFVQGNVFGMEVSGNPVETTIMRFTPTEGVSELISGGKFGIEGSICTTIVLTVGVLILLFYPYKSKNRVAIDNNITNPE